MHARLDFVTPESWPLLCSHMGRYQLTPLSYEGLDHASSFASDQCAEGVCAIAKSSLRILTIERLGEVFNQQVWTCSEWNTVLV